jgi:zinc transporter, ZIP family
LPEGLIISLSVYCATGSRWLSFAISASVGIISQMSGAGLGYLLYVTIWNEAISGVLYSIVTAALLYAVLHAMIPMAYHYDPTNRYVTNYLFGGLIFFTFANSIFSITE